MRRYRKWVLTLGIMAATPGIGTAGPLDFLKSKLGRPADKAEAGNEQTANAEAAGQNAADPASRTPAQPGNQEVAEAIAAALRNARLNGYDIEIEYRNGVAKLTGKIADINQKQEATRLASQVAAVNRVDNQLAVVGLPEMPEDQNGFGNQGPVRQADFDHDRREPSQVIQPAGFEDAASSDGNQQMAEQIAAALAGTDLSSYDIEIRYQDGHAVLLGSVASASQRDRATQLVEEISGVRQVENRLNVQAQTAPAPNAAAPFPGARPPVSPAAHQPHSGQPNPGQPNAGQLTAYQQNAGQPDAAPPAVPPQPGPAPQTGPVPPGYPRPGMPAPGFPGPGMPGPPGPGQPPAPPQYGHPGPGSVPAVSNMPHLPEHAWPSYASYPNYAQVAYPSQYSASAWPYIGPFYPYPQVPLGWRKAQLEWDDGYWHLNFNPRTDRWWWFLNPKKW